MRDPRYCSFSAYLTSTPQEGSPEIRETWSFRINVVQYTRKQKKINELKGITLKVKKRVTRD